MLLSAVYILVVAQSSSEVPEGLMNNPVLCGSGFRKLSNWQSKRRHGFTLLLVTVPVDLPRTIQTTRVQSGLKQEEIRDESYQSGHKLRVKYSTPVNLPLSRRNLKMFPRKSYFFFSTFEVGVKSLPI